MDTDIAFVSTEMSGLYAFLLEEGALYELRVSRDDQVYDHFKMQLLRHIVDGSIKNVNDLKGFVKESLPDRPDKTNKFCDGIDEKAEKYSHFYQQNADLIQKYGRTVEEIQKGYAEDLSKLYDFFGVSRDFKCHGILVPVEEKKIDGMAVRDSFFVFYEVQKKEGEEYVDDSLLLKRKISTPFHEATHLLFSKSLMKKDLKKYLEQSIENKDFYEQNKNGATMLLSALETYFNQNPEAKNKDVDDVKVNCLLAIDEALAACSSIVVEDRYAARGEKDEFYWGFKGADMLARNLYPIYCDYMAQGKKMDDDFLMKVAGKVQNQMKERDQETLQNKIEVLKKRLPYVSPAAKKQNTIEDLRGIGIEKTSEPVKKTSLDVAKIRQNSGCTQE